MGGFGISGSNIIPSPYSKVILPPLVLVSCFKSHAVGVQLAKLGIYFYLCTIYIYLASEVRSTPISTSLSAPRSAPNQRSVFVVPRQLCRWLNLLYLPTHSPSESPMKTVNPSSEHDPQLERQAVRKLDYTILPIMTIFYLLSFLVCSFWPAVFRFFF